METRHVLVVVTILYHSIFWTECVVENFEMVRGVSIKNAKLYVFGKDFVCLDGSSTVPYSYINDDYCDCLDGSDEPGTSACTNGTFYCTNTGHIPFVIPSSRVNDGICDCCDGSDEWANNLQKVTCQNTCKDLYRAAKEYKHKLDDLYSLGFEIRAQLIAKGKYLLMQKQNEIVQLLSKIKDAQFIRSSAFYDQERNEKKEKLNEQNEAFKIFNEIDTNKNNKIEVDEVKVYSIFDQNKDNLVSQNEINYLMKNKKELDLKDFMSNGWNRVKPLIFSQYIGIKKTVPANINIKEKDLNQDLKTTRKLYDEADTIIKEFEKKIFNLQKSISKNFGLENEFAALDEQCYELTDHEYIYTLCLFDKVTQKSINSGLKVNLGVWNDWVNRINDEPKYHTMLYDKGQYCLSNHQRFTYVHLSCGLKPKLITVSEPNRCEYLMEFELPSVCVLQDDKYLRELREEL